MLKKAWQAVGVVGDAHFLLTALGGVVVLGAIGAGLLATLTAIPTAYLIIASAGLILLLAAIVPLLLRGMWLRLVGPSLVVGDWRVMLSTHNSSITGTAVVSVWNRHDAGGERATARGVVPQVEIFDLGGRRMFHHVGWAGYSKRDFSPTREEEQMTLAQKEHTSGTILVGHPNPLHARATDTFQGTITLRGENLRRPVTASFIFGLRKDGSLWLEEGRN